MMPRFSGWEMAEGVLRGGLSWVGGLSLSVEGSGPLPQYLSR